MKNFKTTFQDIHYNRQKISLPLKTVLNFSEFFYKNAINFKNFLYEKNILKEEKMNAYIVCVGNLTTGGVGKTPIVEKLANEYSKDNNVAVISRGYKSKISNKNPVVIKDFEGLKFKDGSLCSDEPFQLAKKTNKNVMVITCSNRKKAINKAIKDYNCNFIILDDGFSNRKVKKDKTLLAIDSKMRFGNNKLLPLGPLREPISQIKRADEIIIVNKGDEDILNSIDWAKQFNKPLKLCSLKPCRIYNIQTKAQVINTKKAIAFCAIGQSGQFFDFAKNYYEVIQNISFEDHHKYTKKDIDNLLKIASKNNINTFITTQKDETKLYPLIKDIKGYSFNVLELQAEIETI